MQKSSLLFLSCPKTCSKRCAQSGKYMNPENTVGKHVYEKVGFKPENKMADDEELFKIVLKYIVRKDFFRRN